MYMLVDITGHMPTPTQDVQIGLFKKPTTNKTKRPLGFYRAYYRLWAATNMPEVRAWEQAHAMQKYFNLAPKRSTTDPVWRQSVKSERVQANNRVTITTSRRP